MESLSWTTVLLALAGSFLMTMIVFLVLVIQDRRSQP